MYLFLKHGGEEKPPIFYQQQYLLVAPEMMKEVPQNNPHVNPMERFTSNFNHKFFNRFCDFFGLVEIRTEKGKYDIDQIAGVKKTALADLVFEIKG